MKWFNTIVNRLFGSDEQEMDELEKQPPNEKEFTNVLRDKQHTTSFRFPMISDAEIYGWDDDETITPERPKNATYRADVEEEYETIPLYENDRWKKNTEHGNVYKSGTTPKYERKLVSEPIVHTSKKPKESVHTPSNNVTGAKRPNRPFSPTRVPSPVFGYEDPRIAKMKDLVEHSLEEPVIEEQRVFESKETKQIAFRQAEEIHQVEFVPSEEIHQADFVPSEEIESPEIVDYDGIGFEEVVHNTTNSNDAEIEQLSNIIDTPEEVPMRKKERITPFNVLMLKSDNEKLATRKSATNLNTHIEVQKESFEFISAKSQPIAVAVPEMAIGNNKFEAVIKDDMESEEPPYYAFPSLDFLIPPEKQIEDTEWLELQAEKLEEALSYFAVQATVIEAVQGPTVTRFEFTVGHGTKVSKIRNLADDLKLALAAEDIRIQAPIPGKSSIGIEIPNRKTRPVRISEVIGTKAFQESTSPLEAVLGLGLTGVPVTLDLRKMPHGMIAGATGSGKSVCINSILISLLYKATPTDLKMMLIDPKMVELAPFNGIPHLISPVITDVKAATAALKWAVAEMERRYTLLAHAGVRDIERYNAAAIKSRQFSMKMPYLLIVIDELADLMMMAPADVEVSISRIAQKARACGIHLIIATQRPSVDVITGTIKANVPTRIAFAVSSQIDSRTIIDSPGAERLLGKGDMLYIGNGQSAGVRLQGTFVTDDEIERIIEHVQNEAKPNYLFGQEELLASSIEEEETDPLFEEACVFILEAGSASTSLLQRNFSIGYNRAAKLIDRMEKHGFISGQKGSKARDVYLTSNDLESLTERFE